VLHLFNHRAYGLSERRRATAHHAATALRVEVECSLIGAVGDDELLAIRDRLARPNKPCASF
jgi:hypothetical protein